jgi:hypothetical protein
MDFEGNIRFCVWINFDTEKISGEFSKKDFIEAIDYYIMQNERETISPIMNLRDKTTGEKLYSWGEAFKKAQQKLFAQYYGNKN